MKGVATATMIGIVVLLMWSVCDPSFATGLGSPANTHSLREVGHRVRRIQSVS
jgi:hypothetical protein